MLAAVLAGARGDPPQPASCVKRAGLAGWLCRATFNIPQIPLIKVANVHVPLLGTFTTWLYIFDLKCGHGALHALHSSAVPSGSAPSLQLEADALSLNCSSPTVKVEIFHDGAKSPFATVTAGVELTIKSADVATGLTLIDAGDGLPSAARIPFSLTKLDIDVRLHLASPWSVLDKPIAVLVAQEAESLIPPMIEPALSHVLNTTIDPLLRKLDSWVAAVPAPKPEPPLPPPPTQLVSWEHSEALRAVEYLVDGVVGANGPLGLSGLVRTLTGGSGNLIVDNSTLARLPDLSARVSIAKIPIANVTVHITRIAVRGLANVSEFSMVTPAAAAGARSAHSLDARAGWRRLGLTISGSVDATPLPGGLVEGAGELVEEFTVDLSLGEVSASVLMLLGLNQTYLDTVTAHELATTHPGCIAARALMLAPPAPRPYFGVRGAGLNVSIAELDVGGATFPLEKQIDAALDDAATFFFGVHPHMSALVRSR